MNNVHLIVKPETKRKILCECIPAYLQDNPEMIGVYISHDKILSRMADYYLSRGKL